MKNGQKFKLGDAHASPQEISKKYKHQSLGMPPRHPLLHRQKLGHLSRHYIFIASCTMHFSWSVSCFCFQFSFALFAKINIWITLCVWRETCSIFHLPRTLCFSLLSFQRVLSFSAIAFSLHFLP
jgi:hypothetical protein